METRLDSFARFIPGGTDLDPAAVKAAGFAARLFPDYGNNEVAAVAKALGAERAECWSCGYKGQPDHLAPTSIDDAARHAFDFGYLNVLVAFAAAQAHIWLPDHHEFFVIFAPLAALEKIRTAGIFTYDYDEYAHEQYFAGKRSAFLVEAGRRYTIDPSDETPMSRR